MAMLTVFYIILKTFVTLRKRGFLPSCCRGRHFRRNVITARGSATSHASRPMRLGHGSSKKTVSPATGLQLSQDRNHPQRPYAFAYGTCMDDGDLGDGDMDDSDLDDGFERCRVACSDAMAMACG